MFLDCPRCNQGIIYKFLIIPINTIIHVCGECDATWQVGEVISKDKFTSYTTYLNSIGITDNRTQWADETINRIDRLSIDEYEEKTILPFNEKLQARKLERIFVECPKCKQGYIAKILIIPVNTVIYICGICEATWEANKPISVDKFIPYPTYLSNIGITAKKKYRSIDTMDTLGRLTIEEYKKILSNESNEE